MLASGYKQFLEIHQNISNTDKLQIESCSTDINVKTYSLP